MKKFYKCIENTGFTLIEIIIVLAIVVLVSSVAFSLQLFGNRTYKATTDKAQKQFEVRMPADFIAKNIRFADTLTIRSSLPASPAAGSHQIYIDASGRLIFKKSGIETTIIGASDTANYKFSATKKSGTSNIVTFVVGMEGTNAYDLTTDVEVLNLDTIGISGDIAGTYIEFFTEKADHVIPLTISSVINPITVNTPLNGIVTMPLRVIANMDDGTQRQVAVTWNPHVIDTSTTGIKTSVGSIVGYSHTTLFRVIVGPVNIATVEDINITTYKDAAFVMPNFVVATTDTGDMLEVPVSSWSVPITTDVSGSFISEGTVSGYSGFVTLTVIVNDNSISSIQSLNFTVSQGVSFTMPSQVNATLSDGSILSVPVTWSPSTLDTMTSGIKTSTGNVTGYGPTITLTLNVTPSQVPTPICTVISSGNNGSVKVYGLVGASVKLRKSNGQVIGTGIIAANGEVTITGVNTNNIHDAILSMAGWNDSLPYVFS